MEPQSLKDFFRRPTDFEKLENVMEVPASHRGNSPGSLSDIPVLLHMLHPTIGPDYFHSTIGPVKKVLLTYGPNGQSRGVATVIFVKHDSAVKAAKDLNGLKVDKRPMKIELIMGAKEIPDPVPAKSLGDRIDKPKSAVKAQPKSATTAKPAVKGSGRRGRPSRGRNAGRGKPKSAQELDMEMVDYFGTETNGNTDATMNTNDGAVQPVANGGDAGMDEIM